LCHCKHADIILCLRCNADQWYSHTTGQWLVILIILIYCGLITLRGCLKSLDLLLHCAQIWLCGCSSIASMEQMDQLLPPTKMLNASYVIRADPRRYFRGRSELYNVHAHTGFATDEAARRPTSDLKYILEVCKVCKHPLRAKI